MKTTLVRHLSLDGLLTPLLSVLARTENKSLLAVSL
jgi:hypothetical protein